MKRKNNFLIIFFLLFFSIENISAEVLNKFQQKLSFNNHFLDINYKKELLSFVMIYFYELKNNQNNSLLNSLAYLLSNSKKIAFIKAKNEIKNKLLSSNNPIDFYRSIQK
ncbi:hypothetical protein [Sulfurimonas hydrogeniphila]|uniref:hypothetical protein n=1 Tax=Sulfurimonas hydrogeniphila TaxID=2509341 RepID=UPI00125FA645|nr:hypothetical protein [Sulfurimonas hydrogeniphila]